MSKRLVAASFAAVAVFGFLFFSAGVPRLVRWLEERELSAYPGPISSELVAVEQAQAELSDLEAKVDMSLVQTTLQFRRSFLKDERFKYAVLIRYESGAGTERFSFCLAEQPPVLKKRIDHYPDGTSSADWIEIDWKQAGHSCVAIAKTGAKMIWTRSASVTSGPGRLTFRAMSLSRAASIMFD